MHLLVIQLLPFVSEVHSLITCCCSLFNVFVTSHAGDAQTPYLDFRDLLLREKKGWEWQGTGDVEGAGAVEGWFAPPMFVILKNTLLKHLWL